MANDCLFCQMAGGDEEYHTVYEDDDVLAIMDIHPINPGHVLVFPRDHQTNFHGMDDDPYHHLMGVSKDLAEVLDYLYEPKRVGMLVAGFDIPHVHVHLVPMHQFHDITSKKIIDGQRGDPTPVELEERAAEIREVIEDPVEST